MSPIHPKKIGGVRLLHVIPFQAAPHVGTILMRDADGEEWEQGRGSVDLIQIGESLNGSKIRPATVLRIVPKRPLSAIEREMSYRYGRPASSGRGVF